MSRIDWLDWEPREPRVVLTSSQGPRRPEVDPPLRDPMSGIVLDEESR